MTRIRVLVVEDSPTVRQRLVEIVGSDPDLDLVGQAGDGMQAIEMCRRCRPDIITMDMMLPMMSGLAATEYIMAHCPTPILVVSASINRGELFKIYEALAAGAVDVLEKPLGTEREGVWERRFLAMIKLAARIRVITHPRGRLAGRGGRRMDGKETAPVRAKRNFDLVAIGASTGGPGAIVEVLRGLPPAFRLPILIVLHINEPFGTAFADWLDGQTTRRVECATDGAAVSSVIGRVIVAPAGRHLLVREGRMHLTAGAARHSCRPSVDVLFESVACEYGPRAAACLLTGMGKDGALGLLSIRQAGGLTIAQDERSSIVYGMPREAAVVGGAQYVLPLGDIAGRLAALDSPQVAART
jgi:two-component system, chemotaxis family, protein-glutamate methylesterase/glutaminase